MDFLLMGKYGAYVWSSFGITGVVLVICVLQASRRHKMVLRDLTARIKAMEPER